MLFSVTFSKPAKNCAQILGKEYVRVKMHLKSDAGLTKSMVYEAHFFTETQVFQKQMTLSECEAFCALHTGTTFKNVVQRTECEEITILTNRHGKQRVLRKKTDAGNKTMPAVQKSAGEKKKYILPEGKPLLFLQRLGVMTAEGHIVSQKYDKFRQINKYLSFVSEILPSIFSLAQQEKRPFCPDRPLRIIDFGCGKSYLTFAVYYYVSEIEKIPTEIVGLDLKKEVIASCEALAKECGYEGLHFFAGDIADFDYRMPEPDIVMTLHACDTTTDLALQYAITHNAKAILSVPCCQHEINAQLSKTSVPDKNAFAPFLRYGLIKERFAALLTDTIRAELLEQYNYTVQVLEFIDMEGTPKNLLLRAVKKQILHKKSAGEQAERCAASQRRLTAVFEQLPISQSLHELLSH